VYYHSTTMNVYCTALPKVRHNKATDAHATLL